MDLCDKCRELTYVSLLLELYRDRIVSFLTAEALPLPYFYYVLLRAKNSHGCKPDPDAA
jgi:hypothetical protein